MKTTIIILVLLALVFGLLLVGKNKGDVITESDLSTIEEQKASEPTVEESLDAQFGISEEEAEARYSAEMQ